MFDNIKPAAALSGRILLSLIFLLSGMMKIMDWNGTAAQMADKGMPAIPFFLTMAILFELGAGACLLFGFQARSASLALVLYLIPTTLVFHNFWAATGSEFQNQMHHFLKNLAIMGGARHHDCSRGGSAGYRRLASPSERSRPARARRDAPPRDPAAGAVRTLC